MNGDVFSTTKKGLTNMSTIRRPNKRSSNKGTKKTPLQSAQAYMESPKKDLKLLQSMIAPPGVTLRNYRDTRRGAKQYLKDKSFVWYKTLTSALNEEGREQFHEQFMEGRNWKEHVALLIEGWEEADEVANEEAAKERSRIADSISQGGTMDLDDMLGLDGVEDEEEDEGEDEEN